MDTGQVPSHIQILHILPIQYSMYSNLFFILSGLMNTMHCLCLLTNYQKIDIIDQIVLFILTLIDFVQEDLVSLGRIVLALACNSFVAIQRENVQQSMELVASNYRQCTENRIQIDMFSYRYLNRMFNRVWSWQLVTIGSVQKIDRCVFFSSQVFKQNVQQSMELDIDRYQIGIIQCLGIQIECSIEWSWQLATIDRQICFIKCLDI